MKNIIINTAIPFSGHIESYLLRDGTVGFTQGMTFDEYNKIHGGHMKVVDEAEFQEMVDEHSK